MIFSMRCYVVEIPFSEKEWVEPHVPRQSWCTDWPWDVADQQRYECSAIMYRYIFKCYIHMCVFYRFRCVLFAWLCAFLWPFIFRDRIRCAYSPLCVCAFLEVRMSHRSWVFTELDDHQQERQTRTKKMHETSGGYIGNNISNVPCAGLKDTWNFRIVNKNCFDRSGILQTSQKLSFLIWTLIKVCVCLLFWFIFLDNIANEYNVQIHTCNKHLRTGWWLEESKGALVSNMFNCQGDGVQRSYHRVGSCFFLSSLWGKPLSGNRVGCKPSQF